MWGQCQAGEKGSELTDVPGTSAARLLIDRCNRGDSRAWEELYGQYHAMITRAVKRYCGRGPDESEDLVHEVFIQLFRALKGYDANRPLEAYILEIARRVGISRFRKDSALKRGGTNPGTVSLNTHRTSSRDERAIDVPSLEADQEAALINAHEVSRLRSALGKLSENCRKLLFLRYDQGLSYKEIAGKFAVKEGALRVRVQRCLSALAAAYAEEATQGARNR